MLSLDDSRWRQYDGAMGNSYDASNSLRQLLDAGPSDELWNEFWNNLVYQDSIGTASFAAVPYLVHYLEKVGHLEWNILSIIAIVEIERENGYQVPTELATAYRTALTRVCEIILRDKQETWDELTTRSAVSCIAAIKGQRELARIYGEMTLDDGRAWLAQMGD